MNGHVVMQLEAYYDGELTGPQRRRVMLHLETCAECRAALAQLEQLGGLLRSVAVPPTRLTPERFAAQVRLQLQPREASAPHRRRWAVPVLLVGAWSFFEAVWLVSGGLMATAAWGLDEALGLPGLFPAGGVNFWHLLESLEMGRHGMLPLFSFVVSVLWSALLPLVLLGGVAILFWTWWFAQRPGSMQA